MFRELANMLVVVFNTIANTFVAGNNLAEAGALRTAVVKHKSRNAAALSQIRGDTDFVKEFAKLKEQADNLDENARTEAEEYLNAFE